MSAVRLKPFSVPMTRKSPTRPIAVSSASTSYATPSCDCFVYGPVSSSACLNRSSASLAASASFVATITA